MAAFAAGEADVLVATSVIEVGIDVPNATVMLIEAAERYGISQLHQLRGRIGRGEHESICILFGDPSLPRLEAVAKERDGFKLAEIDLQIRGAGEVLGTRQHGMPEFKVARLPEDVVLLERARERAGDLLGGRPAARRARERAPPRGDDGTLRVRHGPDPGLDEDRRRTAQGAQAARARGRRHAADRRQRARGALLDPRPGGRTARARPLCGLGRARDRSAVARRGVGDVRRRRRARRVAAIRANLDATGEEAEVAASDVIEWLRAAGGSDGHSTSFSAIRPMMRRPASRRRSPNCCRAWRRRASPHRDRILQAESARARPSAHRRADLRRHPDRDPPWPLRTAERPSAPGPTTR